MELSVKTDQGLWVVRGGFGDRGSIWLPVPSCMAVLGWRSGKVAQEAVTHQHVPGLHWGTVPVLEAWVTQPGLGLRCQPLPALVISSSHVARRVSWVQDDRPERSDEGGREGRCWAVSGVKHKPSPAAGKRAGSHHTSRALHGARQSKEKEPEPGPADPGSNLASALGLLRASVSLL